MADVLCISSVEFLMDLPGSRRDLFSLVLTGLEHSSACTSEKQNIYDLIVHYLVLTPLFYSLLVRMRFVQCSAQQLCVFFFQLHSHCQTQISLIYNDWGQNILGGLISSMLKYSIIISNNHNNSSKVDYLFSSSHSKTFPPKNVLAFFFCTAT